VTQLGPQSPIQPLELVEIRAFPFIKEMNAAEGFDYVLMEGLVANEEDLETLKRVRQSTKVLVALGACAHTGCVPAYRHFTLPQHFEHLLYAKEGSVRDLEASPIDRWVHVDYTIPGCPPNKAEILGFLKAIVLGKAPLAFSDPVCVECRRRNVVCLLDLGKPCLGPVTRGGCEAVCPKGGLECWGCRGQTDDANLALMVKTLRDKGFSLEFIKARMKTFVGLKAPRVDEVFTGMGAL